MTELGMNIGAHNITFWEQMTSTLFIVFFLFVLYQLIKYLTSLPHHIQHMEEQIKVIDLKLEEVRNKL